MAAASSRFQSVHEEDLDSALVDQQIYAKTIRLFALDVFV